jgi:hypothetical protein
VTPFVGSFVGFLVGFSGQPDNHSPFAINDLNTICRVCQVFITGESPGGLNFSDFRAGRT